VDSDVLTGPLYSTDSPLNTEKLCAIRYLAGILELPKFWRLKTEERIDIEKRLFGFLSRLCETNFQLIRDTEPSGSGHSEDDPSPLWTSARSAVDILAFTTFSGFLQLHGLYEELPPCPSQLPSMVTLLIRYVSSGWKVTVSLFIFFEITDPKWGRVSQKLLVVRFNAKKFYTGSRMQGQILFTFLLIPSHILRRNLSGRIQRQILFTILMLSHLLAHMRRS